MNDSVFSFNLTLIVLKQAFFEFVVLVPLQGSARYDRTPKWLIVISGTHGEEGRDCQCSCRTAVEITGRQLFIRRPAETCVYTYTKTNRLTQFKFMCTHRRRHADRRRHGRARMNASSYAPFPHWQARPHYASPSRLRGCLFPLPSLSTSRIALPLLVMLRNACACPCAHQRTDNRESDRRTDRPPVHLRIRLTDRRSQIQGLRGSR